MVVEVYDCVVGATLFKHEMSVSEIMNFVILVKEFGCENDDGDDYKFNDVKVNKDGVIIYVELG